MTSFRRDSEEYRRNRKRIAVEVAAWIVLAIAIGIASYAAYVDWMSS